MYTKWNDRLLVWGSQTDQNTILQAEKLARLPIVFDHVALMTDAHVGIGATVGSVFATKNAIIPAAIGVDIGCGMIAIHTSLHFNQIKDKLQIIYDDISRSIPAGVNQHRNVKSKGLTDQKLIQMAQNWLEANLLSGAIPEKALENLGTLGSGNHFCEISVDEHDEVWTVLHSGSRGVGNQLARKHIDLAKMQKQKLEDPDLAYFTNDTQEFSDYVRDMLWAQTYALENRNIMMTAMLLAIQAHVGQFKTYEKIQCHHNFSAKENHDGEDVWITRKGAIRAKIGDLGIIPGSMGTSTYIVEGLQNKLSWMSASHGAGRLLSRRQAKETLSKDTLLRFMTGKIWNNNAQALLDEHPNAYKDIELVMKEQSDLVKPLYTLKQILNYKGV